MKLEIKRTQRNGVSFYRSHVEPDRILVLHLTPDSWPNVAYNGPSEAVTERMPSTPQKNGQTGISLRTLAALDRDVGDDDRLPQVRTFPTWTSRHGAEG